VGKRGEYRIDNSGDKRARERPYQRDEKEHGGGDSSRDRDKDCESRNREAEVKDNRASSRDERREAGRREKDASLTERRRTDGKKNEGVKKKETSSTERGGTDAKKGEGNKEKGGRVDGQKERKRKEHTGLDEVDEDERDRRNIEDIQRRMYARCMYAGNVVCMLVMCKCLLERTISILRFVTSRY